MLISAYTYEKASQPNIDQKSSRNPEIVCIAIYDPVCGEDGNTYPNECEAKAHGVGVKHRGKCEVSDPDANTDKKPRIKVRDPEIVCPAVYKPVCGEDGNTYPNSCEARAHGVKVLYDGECGDNIGYDVKPRFQNIRELGLVIYLEQDIVVDFDILSSKGGCVYGTKGSDVQIIRLSYPIVRKQINPDKCYFYPNMSEIDCKYCKDFGLSVAIDSIQKVSDKKQSDSEDMDQIRKIADRVATKHSAKIRRIEIDHQGNRYVVLERPIRIFNIQLPIAEEIKIDISSEISP